MANDQKYISSFQSTPSQRGRLRPTRHLVKTWFISIHALAKRATGNYYSHAYIADISIHALAKRATWATYGIKITRLHFNPRPRKEGDVRYSGYLCVLCYFNPRPRKEGDLRTSTGRSLMTLFQSTPSQRGRQPLTDTPSRQVLFQSTPSQRGRPSVLLRLWARLRFQSTPSQRGRLACGYVVPINSCISIHALAKRATTARLHFLRQTLYFNPRPRKEGDIQPSPLQSGQPYFNPRPRKEGDQSLWSRSGKSGHFNPRPRKEGDRKFIQ